MKLDSTNIRSIVLISIFVIYFTLIMRLPSSFYNSDGYQPFWNGLTNMLIFAFYVIAAGWMLTNARRKNQIMLIISTIVVFSISLLFFKLFTTSFIG